ncbi:hypothetical protein PoB_003843500 [Plakobranchus ocellatus]|uniref:Uncharacterized protein n=1 Tax=Plakobranchus ocellatus TaxID=259542 RepID=A0AAV4AXE0_9GAST|nr:hypothetical protein PoB_003843500 [Plakobranchus ocellatus]
MARGKRSPGGGQAHVVDKFHLHQTFNSESDSGQPMNIAEKSTVAMERRPLRQVYPAVLVNMVRQAQPEPPMLFDSIPSAFLLGFQYE